MGTTAPAAAVLRKERREVAISAESYAKSATVWRAASGGAACGAGVPPSLPSSFGEASPAGDDSW
jgi:hypothetical protein